jgi:hypothetical protein
MANYRIFIDESCHLEHDNSDVMTIGYIKVPEESYENLKYKINSIKIRYGVPHELKWNNLSKSKLPLFIELTDLFFSSELSFRAIVVKYKRKLDHAKFNKGSHDNFYYKMIYFLLNNTWINPIEDNYRVFIDIKDTRGREKLTKIQEVFSNLHKGSSPFDSFQHIRSHESVYIQLADLFVGAITYRSRGLSGEIGASEGKKGFIDYLEVRSGYSLNEGTEPWEKKFNIFDHQPKMEL